MHAVARLALHPLITNIQTSWVKMGPDGVALCLQAGANDLGGTLMNESITRAAGAHTDRNFHPRRWRNYPLDRPHRRGNGHALRPALERCVPNCSMPQAPAPVAQTPPRKMLAAE